MLRIEVHDYKEINKVMEIEDSFYHTAWIFSFEVHLQDNIKKFQSSTFEEAELNRNMIMDKLSH